jgi:hypothetical protein
MLKTVGKRSHSECRGISKKVKGICSYLQCLGRISDIMEEMMAEDFPKLVKNINI